MEILLVEGGLLALSLAEALRGSGHCVEAISDSSVARDRIARHSFDAIVTEGLETLRKIREVSPHTLVLVTSSSPSIEEAVAAMREGAFDYLPKPFRASELLLRIGAIERERSFAPGAIENVEAGPAKMVGRSAALEKIVSRLAKFAASDAPVLIRGESGTGKELIALSLHQQSPRRRGPFVAVNCAGLPEALLEAELFGHERGAFTGAVKKREGRFKSADGGTLFLDEVAEIPMAAQAKLLRVLQSGTFEPLGTDQSVSVDVRILSATHQNLKERLGLGLFREDLYYRLHVLELEMPPLRERPEDLPLLLEHFLRVHSAPGRRSSMTPAARAVIAAHSFPGNIRELENAIRHAIAMTASGETEIDVGHLPPEIAALALEASLLAEEIRPLHDSIQEFERELLSRALVLSGGRKLRAAEKLGITRKTLWEKLRRHGLNQVEATDESVIPEDSSSGEDSSPFFLDPLLTDPGTRPKTR